MKVDIDTSDMLYAEAWQGFKGTDWQAELMSVILFSTTIRLMKGTNPFLPRPRRQPPHCGKK
ncbi:Ketobutyrate formate-lyase [Raoultella ornithinolytica]|nr:Ketobutyrate formate-lyase [Raoultella ornithinolytica]